MAAVLAKRPGQRRGLAVRASLEGAAGAREKAQQQANGGILLLFAQYVAMGSKVPNCGKPARINVQRTGPWMSKALLSLKP
jgi:hypothetical protein